MYNFLILTVHYKLKHLLFDPSYRDGQISNANAKLFLSVPQKTQKGDYAIAD